MTTTKKIHSISDVKSRFAEIIDELNETSTPVIVTQNGQARAVIQDPQSFENMRQAIAILKLVALGEVDIREGKLISQEKLFDEIEGSLKPSKS